MSRKIDNIMQRENVNVAEVCHFPFSIEAPRWRRGRRKGRRISFLMFLDQNGQFFDKILTTGMYIVFTDNLFNLICGKKNKFEEQYVINKALKVNPVLKVLERNNHHRFNVGSEINVFLFCLICNC